MTVDISSITDDDVDDHSIIKEVQKYGLQMLRSGTVPNKTVVELMSGLTTTAQNNLKIANDHDVAQQANQNTLAIMNELLTGKFIPIGFTSNAPTVHTEPNLPDINPLPGETDIGID